MSCTTWFQCLYITLSNISAIFPKAVTGRAYSTMQICPSTKLAGAVRTSGTWEMAQQVNKSVARRQITPRSVKSGSPDVLIKLGEEVL